MRITVFLSYSRADRETADVIEDLLRRHGIGCWIDRKGIRLGEQFDDEIKQAIRRSGAVVWLVSSNSVNSNYVRYELTTALHYRRPVLPVRLEPVDLHDLPAPLNRTLGGVHAYDHFASPSLDTGTGLADGIRGLVDRARRMALLRLGGLAAAFGLAGGAGAWGASQLGRATVPPPRSIPPSFNDRTSRDVIEVIYKEASPAPPWGTARAALQIEIEAKRASEPGFTRLKDGGVLASEGDRYRVVGTALSPGYLYLFQIDVADQVDWLFPQNATSRHSSGLNPLATGQSIRVPAMGSLFLNATVGVEHIYAVFSATRWPRLEHVLSRTPPSAESTRGFVQAPNALGLRGVGGVIPDDSPGGVSKVPSVGDRFQGDGYFLVLERWFRHVGL